MSGAPTQPELVKARQWLDDAFNVSEGKFPLSFCYNDASSKDILSTWNAETSDTGLENGALRRTISAVDPGTGLQLRVEITAYSDYPAVEWIAYFKNTGKSDTPIISNIQALDAAFPVQEKPFPKVHYADGSILAIHDFKPYAMQVDPWNPHLNIGCSLGRSSEKNLPFFNIEADGYGFIGAVGWTGSWSADFNWGEGCVINAKAGMAKTHLKLHPGEEIRTPRMLLLFWENDRMHGHNMLRRLILAHYTPRPNGNILQAPVCQSAWGENRDHRQITKARWMHDNDIPVDTYWIDAGWHGDAEFKEDSNVFNSGWGTQVGNWWPNKTTYPNGLKPIGDALKEMGKGFVLWLEPERVFKDTQFTKEHPEWLLGPIGDNYLYNLGIPEAEKALTELVSNLIQEGGVTIYRQDFNMSPHTFWEAADEPDRVGMSEIRHIEGLYAFWDGLLERNPGLAIDNCASGGRRIDIETASRSIPLWRSDWPCWPGFDPAGTQCQSQGLGLWMPLNTGAMDRVDEYVCRSAYGPGLVSCVDIDAPSPREDISIDEYRRLLEEEYAVRKYFYGDFYPLLPCTVEPELWAAWQYDRPDLGEGMFLAFRRQKSPFESLRAKLHGLSSDARYEVRSLDNGSIVTVSGKTLSEDGLRVGIAEAPGSALFVYKRVD